MFFRLQTRLLIASGLTLLLFVALTVVVIFQLLSLNPAITRLNQLSSGAVRVRDLTLAAQYASTNLNAALVGVSREQQEAREFERLMASLDTTIAAIRQDFSTSQISDDITRQSDALGQALATYRTTTGTLFAAVATQQNSPSPAARQAQEQAVEPASRSSTQFNQLIQTLNTTINGSVDAAQQQLQQQVQQTIASLVGMAILIVLVITAIQLSTAQAIGRPMGVLADAVQRMGQGDLSVRVPAGRRDEVGTLALAFNSMAQAVLDGRKELEDQNHRLEASVQARTTVLQDTVIQLKAAVEQQTALRTLLAGVSTPVLPVAAGVLLMPLIGVLDSQRAEQALQVLLKHVETQRASLVILDVTGLPVIDSSVAATLLQAAQATRLLGAEVILAGISPEVAQTLVTLNIGLGALQPVSDLEAAVTLALQRVRKGSRKHPR